MVSPLAKSNVEHDGALGNRCPAGSHIQAQGTANVPHLGQGVTSKLVLKSFPVSDTPQSAETEDDNQQLGNLSDSAFTAEQKRIEARKNHKRFTDAIYARRRREREKEAEQELVREAEHARKANQKLRVENNKLQTMLSGAIAEVEAMGDTEKKWLHDVLEKAKATSVPTTKETDETYYDRPKLKSTKRSSEHIKRKSKHTLPRSVEAGIPLRSVRRKTEFESTQVEDTSAEGSGMSQPLNEMYDSVKIKSTERKNRRDDNDAPHPTDKRAIEALQQASYLQGLRDAVLLNRARGIPAETYNHPQQPQPRPVATIRSQQAGILQSTVRNDPIHQHSIDQLLLARRINALNSCPDASSVLRPELSSVLNQSSVLRGGYTPAPNPLSRSASVLDYPPNQTLISALDRLRNVNPATTPPSLPSSLTAARILAIRNSIDSNQLQMQLGLLNNYTDRTDALTSYLQRRRDEQQVSLLAQLRQQEQQSPPPAYPRHFTQGARRI